MAQSLTAPERETIIRTSDDEELVHIWTAQRAYITALDRRDGVTKVAEGFIGTSAWAEYTVPQDQWTPLGLKRKMNLSAEERRRRGERLRKNQK